MLNNNLIPIETTLADIRPGPFQHRQYFDRERLADLAQSIQTGGLVNPPIVYANGHYDLISGERRWRALCALALCGSGQASLEEALSLACRPDAPAYLLAQWGHILAQSPVTVRLSAAADPQVWHVLAVIDNAQQENLNPIEEARDFQSLQQQYDWTDRRVAREIGVSEVRVKARLRWLDLAEDIQTLVAEGKLPRDRRVADALLTIADSGQRLKMARYHSDSHSSIPVIVQSCANLVRNLAKPAAARARRSSDPAALPMADDGQRAMLQLVQTGAGLRHGPLPHGALRQAAREMCQVCPVKEMERLAELPEPAWVIVATEATGTCNSCPARQARVVCGQCPGATLLKNIMANYTGERL